MSLSKLKSFLFLCSFLILCLTQANSQLVKKCCPPKPKLKGFQCEAYMPRYYYNAKTKKCIRFIYGGCGEPKYCPYFLTLKECEKNCSVQTPPSPPPPSKRCKLEPISGPCKAIFERFYYDKKKGKCKKFIYGGCGEDKDYPYFRSRKECKKVCVAGK